MSKNITKITFLLGILSLAVLSVSAYAQNTPATGQKGVSIVPTQTDPNNSLSKRWFIEKINPGESVERSADIQNLNSEEKTIKIVARDRVSTTDGNFNFANETDTPKSVGSWIELSTKEITIPAQKQASIKFKVNVPADTKPGEYAGAITVQEVSKTGNSSGFSLVSVVGSRVYVTVPGEHYTGTEFSNFEFINPNSKGYGNYVADTVTSPYDSVFMNWKLKNTGNIFSKMKGKLEVTTPSKSDSFNKDFDLAPFDNEVNVAYLSLPLKWEIGKYTAKFTFQNAALISNNKESNLQDRSSTTTIQTEFNMTQELLDKMKADKEKASVDSSSFRTSNGNDQDFQITNNLKDEESKIDDKNMVLYIVIALLVIILLAVLGFFGYKNYQAKKKTTPVVKDDKKEESKK